MYQTEKIGKENTEMTIIITTKLTKKDIKLSVRLKTI